MERVFGTISDGDRTIIGNVPILMRETRWPEGGTSWQGDFELPMAAPLPLTRRFYWFKTTDGRTGQIVVRSVDADSHRNRHVRFRTTGPFG